MIDSLNHMARLWSDWMWAMTWQVSLLIVFIAAVDLAIRKWAWPQLRYGLWLMVVVKLLLPPTYHLPTSITAQLLPSAIGREAQVDTPEFATPIERSANPVRASVPAVDTNTATRPPSANGGSVSALSHAGSPPDTRPSKSARPSGLACAMLVWFACVVSLVGYLSVRLYHLRRVAFSDGTHDLPDWLPPLLADVSRRLRLRRPPQVIVSGRTASPAVFGVLQPTLLLPRRGLERLSPTRAEHVLLHELAHIKRGDLIVHAVYLLVQIIYWFNPMLWPVRRRLQQLRELCCDATVANLLRENTSGYRQTLVDAASEMLATSGPEPGLGLLGIGEHGSALGERLSWLERDTWTHARLHKTVTALAAGFAFICILPMATAQIRSSGDRTGSSEENRSSREIPQDQGTDALDQRNRNEDKPLDNNRTTNEQLRDLAFTVLDAGGKPIDGASISVYPDHVPSGFLLNRQEDAPSSPQPLTRMETDEDGKALLSSVPNDHLRIWITHPRHRPALWGFAKPGHSSHRIYLLPHLQGTVRDEAGQPVEGAWISNRVSFHHDSRTFPRAPNLEIELPDNAFEPGKRIAIEMAMRRHRIALGRGTVSDSDGHFTLDATGTARNLDTEIPIIAIDSENRMAIVMRRPEEMLEPQHLTLHPTRLVRATLDLKGVKREQVGLMLRDRDGQAIFDVPAHRAPANSEKFIVALRLPEGGYRLFLRNGMESSEDLVIPFEVMGGETVLDLGTHAPLASKFAALQGHDAPELSVSTRAEKRLSMAELRGKVVILFFWSYQSTSVYDLPEVVEMANRWRDSPVFWIAVHLHDSALVGGVDALPDKLAAIQPSEGLATKLASVRNAWGSWPNLEVVVDRAEVGGRRYGGLTMSRYGVNRFPSFIVVGPDGKVVGDVWRKQLDDLIPTLLPR